MKNTIHAPVVKTLFIPEGNPGVQEVSGVRVVPSVNNVEGNTNELTITGDMEIRLSYVPEVASNDDLSWEKIDLSRDDDFGDGDLGEEALSKLEEAVQEVKVDLPDSESLEWQVVLNVPFTLAVEMERIPKDNILRLDPQVENVNWMLVGSKAIELEAVLKLSSEEPDTLTEAYRNVDTQESLEEEENVETSGDKAAPVEESIETSTDSVETSFARMEIEEEEVEPSSADNTEAVEESEEVSTDRAEAVEESVEASTGSAEAIEESVEVSTESAEPVEESVEVSTDSTEPVEESVEVSTESAEPVEENVEVSANSAEPVEESVETSSDSEEVVEVLEKPQTVPVIKQEYIMQNDTGTQDVKHYVLKFYIVQSGEDLDAIAEKHQVNKENILALNQINEEEIRTGQVLSVPKE